MTNREKAIVMAHTGICMLEGEKLGVFYQYLNELYGRPVYTHEWVTLDIKEKSKPDFLQLCKEEEPERRGTDGGRRMNLKLKKILQEEGLLYSDIPHAKIAFTRVGRWEDIEHAPNGLLYATCSVCGKRQTVEAVNYCGNCGAKMDEVEE